MLVCEIEALQIILKSNIDKLQAIWHKGFDLDLALTVAANSTNSMLFLRNFETRDLFNFPTPFKYDMLFVGEYVLEPIHSFTFGHDLNFIAKEVKSFPSFDKLDLQLQGLAAAHGKTIYHIISPDWNLFGTSGTPLFAHQSPYPSIISKNSVSAGTMNLNSMEGTTLDAVQQFPKNNLNKMFIIWHETFDRKIASAVAGNAANTMLFLKKFNLINLFLLPKSTKYEKLIIGVDELQKDVHCLSFGTELASVFVDVKSFPTLSHMEKMLLVYADRHRKAVVHVISPGWTSPLYKEFDCEKFLTIKPEL